ncbi:MAG: DoxX family membrane protein [bacterium]|nr:DoxX family membrane protein [bacterium]
MRNSLGGSTIFETTPVEKYLFSNTRTAWVWLLARLYLGWAWLTAGVGKFNNPAWIGEDTGKSISGFVKGALVKTTGEHPDVQGWYAAFLEKIVLPNASFWSYLIVYGEILVGIALLLGLFTGVAAFFGAFMNFSFLFAGAVSTNPLMVLVSLFLILAWKVAGYWGVDYWLLPNLGTPWRPGKVFHEGK